MDNVLIEYTSVNGIFFQHRVMNRDYLVKPATHDYCELLYVVKGKVGLSINNTYVEVGENEVAMIGKNVYHTTRMFEGVCTELMVLGVPTELLPPFAGLDFIQAATNSPAWAYCIPSDISIKNGLLVYYQAINDLVMQKNLAYMDAFITAEIIRLVAYLNISVDETMGKNIFQLDDKDKNLLDACLLYINANITKNLTLDDIAQAVHFSKSYIQHTFKRQMGTSVSGYISTQKMTIARSLLTNNEAPSEVAEKLGYEYYTTFSVKFKRFYGMSPKDISKGIYIQNMDMEDIERLNLLARKKSEK